MTTLHDRLAELADEAPPGGPLPELWSTGVRRHRRRRAILVGAAAALVAITVGVVLGLPGGAERSVPPADVPFEQLHLPRSVWAPSEWADGTDELGAPGRLAVVSLATRSSPDGWTGVRQGTEPFGVSAVDGSAVWLDLPDVEPDMLGLGTLTLSPDGTKVGYSVYDGRRLSGWNVYDTTTGETLRLRDERQQVLRGVDAFEIAFSGDSRYLQTNFSPTGSDGSRDDRLVVWDVETGAQIPAEGTGYYWLPNLGSGPQGVVWSRGGRTFTFHPADMTRSSVEVPQRVVEWSDGPMLRSSAYISFGDRDRDPWQLRAGDGRVLDAGIQADDLLGWRDESTVVVAQLPYREVRFVDVTTGEVTASERLELPENGERVFLTPVYAADLWANELVDGVEPPDAHDPRFNPWGVALGAGVLVVAGALVWWRRRVRA
ncbi:hypothetical protein [Nocardioides caricicola]|uniref:WD40 repeat domain-containing protein n=1 Tax=Nocardioides caricicola TaxID=634770 RepID=A0ABW0N1Y3_9ACTN